MAIARKSLGGTKNASVLDRRRSRTAAGALLEMYTLATERERLGQELASAQRRRAEVEFRLTEISEKESRLLNFLTNPALTIETTTIASEQPRGMKMKELSY